MNSSAIIKPPRWYWIVSVVALLWMLFGVLAWVMDLMTDETTLAELSEAQRELYANRPQWIFLLYAVAIFSGFAGTIGLLLRKAWAIPAFWISLVTAVIQFGYTFFGMDAIRLLGAAVALPFPLVILAIGISLLWFSIHSRRNGWIESA